jgi:tRNA G18 (ribose-2'-O)-methylase SpoU
MHAFETHVILENIRSAQNVGAIFRTADAIGVSKIWLTGYTPAPIDRFGRVVPDIAKTALGAEKDVPWEHRDDVSVLVAELHARSMQVVAVELVPQARDYKQYEVTGPTALVFGNEVDGVSKEVLASAHVVIALPMRGKKESLNVATTAGIVLYRLLDR